MQTDANPPVLSVDDEAALLARLRAGDDAAFEVLVRANTGRMLAVARRFFTSEDDACDAVQDAFLSAFKAMPTFEGGSRLSTWLHRITVNACLMKLRTRRRRPERSIEDLLPKFQEDGHRAEAVIAWSAPEDSELDREETRAMIRAAIGQLPESYRIVLTMRDIEGLDTQETARMLDMTESGVKTRLHRARLALRELLDPHFRGEAPPPPPCPRSGGRKP